MFLFADPSFVNGENDSSYKEGKNPAAGKKNEKAKRRTDKADKIKKERKMK